MGKEFRFSSSCCALDTACNPLLAAEHYSSFLDKYGNFDSINRGDHVWIGLPMDVPGWTNTIDSPDLSGFGKAMRSLLALLAVSPVLTLAIVVLWDEFQLEVVTGINGINYKVERKKSRELIELEFPMIVELFAILLAGNQSPATALNNISQRTQGEFSAVLRDAVTEIHKGANFAQALDLLSTRIQSTMVRRFCDSLTIAIERGSPLIEVVNRQVEEVRNEQRSKLMEAAGKAEIALMIPVVFLILPVSVLFALWPSYFSLGRSVGF